MIAEAIEKIINLAREEIIEDDFGRQWIKQENNYNPLTVSPIDTIKTNTLDSIRDFYQVEDPSDSFVLIKNPNEVEVKSIPDSLWGKRQTYLSAVSQKCDFPFGTYLDVEAFIVRLQCCFLDTQTKKELTNFVSSIKTSEVRKAEDDGIAQKVSVENEIGRLETAKFNPVVSLAPYRYFREVDQVWSPFLLRMRKGPNDLPSIALMEADGSEWKILAMKVIKNHLKEILPENIKIIC